MSYRIRPPDDLGGHMITLRNLGGREIILQTDQGDTIGHLRLYIIQHMGSLFGQEDEQKMGDHQQRMIHIIDNNVPILNYDNMPILDDDVPILNDMELSYVDDPIIEDINRLDGMISDYLRNGQPVEDDLLPVLEEISSFANEYSPVFKWNNIFRDQDNQQLQQYSNITSRLCAMAEIPFVYKRVEHCIPIITSIRNLLRCDVIKRYFLGWNCIYNLLRLHYNANIPEHCLFHTMGMTLLYNATLLEQQKSIFISTIGLSAVKFTMERMWEHPDVLAEACVVIMNIGKGSGAHHRYFTIQRSLIIKYILGAMSCHPLHEPLQIEGCNALYMLSHSSTVERMIVDFGGHNVVFLALHNHFKNQELRINALKLLSNLVINKESQLQLAEDRIFGLKYINLLLHTCRYVNLDKNNMNSFALLIQTIGKLGLDSDNELTVQERADLARFRSRLLHDDVQYVSPAESLPTRLLGPCMVPSDNHYKTDILSSAASGQPVDIRSHNTAPFPDHIQTGFGMAGAVFVFRYDYDLDETSPYLSRSRQSNMPPPPPPMPMPFLGGLGLPQAPIQPVSTQLDYEGNIPDIRPSGSLIGDLIQMIVPNLPIVLWKKLTEALGNLCKDPEISFHLVMERNLVRHLLERLCDETMRAIKKISHSFPWNNLPLIPSENRRLQQIAGHLENTRGGIANQLKSSLDMNGIIANFNKAGVFSDHRDVGRMFHLANGCSVRQSMLQVIYDNVNSSWMVIPEPDNVEQIYLDDVVTRFLLCCGVHIENDENTVHILSFVEYESLRELYILVQSELRSRLKRALDGAMDAMDATDATRALIPELRQLVTGYVHSLPEFVSIPRPPRQHQPPQLFLNFNL